MKRLWWVFVPFLLVAFGCATSVPVECPEGYGLTADGADCEIVAGEDPGDGSDGGTEDTSDGGTITPLKTCDVDYDDGNECTDDGCQDGECASVPAEDGAACTFQEGAGVCEAGTCVRDCTIEDCRVVYPCTEQGLRDAVEDGGEIVIGCNGPQTVFLTGGELDMFRDVSIDGLGLLTVDAQGTSRVFVANDTARVELIGMNITGGNAGTDEENSGGGVYAGSYNDVTLRDCRIYGNASRIHGGGIRVSGTLTVTNCEVYENTAAGRGGGIAVFRDATIIDTIVSDNSSVAPGGGIYVTGAEGIVTIRNSVIERNQTPDSGGGIWASGPVTLDGTTVQDNVSGDGGGGVRLYKTGALTTQGGTVFARNTAITGGAIASWEAGSVAVSETTFAENVASDGSGGAIYNDKTPLEVADCRFDGNQASNAAGAVYHKASRGRFLRTSFTNNQAGNVGGAFRIYRQSPGGVDVRFENCTISANQATNTGGGFANRDVFVSLYHTTVSDNIADGGGSDIDQVEGAELHAAHSVFDGGCLTDVDSVLASIGYNGVLTPAAEQCVFTPLEGMATDLGLTAEQMGLAPLGDNGGGTLTHMPMEGSALIDAIPPESCLPDLLRDQRDEPRDGTSPCDIGAVEVQQGE